MDPHPPHTDMPSKTSSNRKKVRGALTDILLYKSFFKMAREVEIDVLEEKDEIFISFLFTLCFTML